MPIDNLIQKRIYELVEYTQLTQGEEGYVSPTSIWLALDMLGWPEAQKISLVQFIESILSVGNPHYLNDGVPYVDQAEVFADFPLEDRNVFDKVNVAGVDYWFKPDVLTLEPYVGSLALADGSITPPKFADMPAKTIYYNKENTVGIPQINTLEQLKIDLGINNNNVKQTLYEIQMPAGNLVTKVAGATFTDSVWGTIVQSDDYDVVITHNLTGRDIAFVNVWENNNGKHRLLSFDKGTAYTTVESENNLVTIFGLAPTLLPIRIELIFK